MYEYEWKTRIFGSSNVSMGPPICSMHTMKQKVNQYESLDMRIFDSLIFKRKNRNKNHTSTNCADPWTHVDLGFTYPRIHRCLERGGRS